jgi:hypothetical protein
MSEKRELSRAELVRKRRAQLAAKELEQTTKRALKPLSTVTSRTARAVKMTAASKPQRWANRRRFNVALGLPEIHLHKPVIVMPRLRPGWRLASFFIAILLSAAIYLALTLSYFHVPNITLLGNDRLSREEIEAVLGVTGQSIFTIQPDILATRLRMNYPELASVEVNTYLPNHVYVTVGERQPVILWQQGNGFTWIDASGVAFRPHGTASGLVPVIGLIAPPAGISPADDPFSPTPFMHKELADAILALAPNVPAGSTMTFDSADGLGWTDSRGWKAFFGTSAHDMPLKVRVYQSLVNSLVSRGRIPVFISVMYPDAPFYRMAEIEVQETTVDNGQ